MSVFPYLSLSVYITLNNPTPSPPRQLVKQCLRSLLINCSSASITYCFFPSSCFTSLFNELLSISTINVCCSSPSVSPQYSIHYWLLSMGSLTGIFYFSTWTNQCFLLFHPVAIWHFLFNLLHLFITPSTANEPFSTSFISTLTQLNSRQTLSLLAIPLWLTVPLYAFHLPPPHLIAELDEVELEERRNNRARPSHTYTRGTSHPCPVFPCWASLEPAVDCFLHLRERNAFSKGGMKQSV